MLPVLAEFCQCTWMIHVKGDPRALAKLTFDHVTCLHYTGLRWNTLFCGISAVIYAVARGRRASQHGDAAGFGAISGDYASFYARCSLRHWKNPRERHNIVKTQNTCCGMSVVTSVSLSSRLLAPFSCKEREWSPSEYHGVVWSPAVHRKRAMWACRECDYEGDRFYHTKKHHLRIHVLHGTAMPRKRKYHKGMLQEQKLQKRAHEALQTRIKIAALTRVKTHQPRLQPELCAQDSKKTKDTREELPQPQQILSSGEFDIKWALPTCQRQRRLV